MAAPTYGALGAKHMCPILKKVMREPVVDPQGHSYEREAIVSWLETHEESPVTKEPLKAADLQPNTVLKEEIDRLHEAQEAATAALKVQCTYSATKVGHSADAAHFCAICEEYLCVDCETSHGENRGTHSHPTQDLRQLKKGQAIPQPKPKCTKHNEPLVLYCTQVSQSPTLSLCPFVPLSSHCRLVDCPIHCSAKSSCARCVSL